MNLNLLLLCVAIIIAITGIAAVVLNEYHEHWLPSDNVDEMIYPDPDSVEAICLTCYDSPEELNAVLESCDGKKWLSVNRPYLLFSNSTHHIDNNDCKWYTNDGYHDTPPSNTEHEFEINTTHPGLTGYKIPDICTAPMIKHLVNYSNMFDNEGFYYIDLIGLDDFISEKDFDTCEHELLTIFYPTINGPKQFDDITETDFTEKCHFIPTTIHANLTDGKVISTPDDC